MLIDSGHSCVGKVPAALHCGSRKLVGAAHCTWYAQKGNESEPE